MEIETQEPTLIGTIHRFGADGILYEVRNQMNEHTALIRVLDTGEEVTYPIASVRADPVE